MHLEIIFGKKSIAKYNFNKIKNQYIIRKFSK